MRLSNDPPPASANGDWQAVTELVERTRQMTELADVEAFIAAETARRGARFYALTSHVTTPTQPRTIVSMLNYPDDWVAFWWSKGLARYDPIFAACFQRLSPFLWDELLPTLTLTPKQQQLMASCAAVGVAHGFTVPLHVSGLAPASFTVIPEDGVRFEGLDTQFYFQMLASYGYAAAIRILGYERADIRRPWKQLTASERACLELAGQGQTDKEIARRLALSPDTVGAYFKSIRHKLKVRSRSQALIVAISRGEISFDNLFGSIVPHESHTESHTESH